MSYSKTIWNESGTTPITAARLNSMEAGIEAAYGSMGNMGADGVQISLGAFKAIICEITISANSAATFTFPTDYFASYAAPPILTTACPNGAYGSYSIADQVSVYGWDKTYVTVNNWDASKQAVVYALVFGF